MARLADERCVALTKQARRLDQSDVSRLISQLQNWTIVQVDGIDHLERRFSFADFARALQFTNDVGAAAEEEDHHPAILTEWGRVTVSWWTHSVRGLHRNDFVMAAKTDRLYTPTAS